MTESTQSAKQKSGIAWTIALILTFILVVLLLFINKITTPRHLSPIELQVYGAFEFDQPRRFKPFELLDHKGEKFTQDNFKDKWSLVFFGFTHCPDICPTTLSYLSSWRAKLDPALLEQTQIILVTVDPARDTVETLAQYVPYFNQDFIGLTGEFLTIKRLANQLNVAFTKVVQGDDYTVDHSGLVAIINPRGDYHGFFKPPFDQEKMLLTYGSIVNNFKY